LTRHGFEAGHGKSLVAVHFAFFSRSAHRQFADRSRLDAKSGIEAPYAALAAAGRGMPEQRGFPKDQSSGMSAAFLRTV
jgi:hypothetical protein